MTFKEWWELNKKKYSPECYAAASAAWNVAIRNKGAWKCKAGHTHSTKKERAGCNAEFRRFKNLMLGIECLEMAVDGSSLHFSDMAKRLSIQPNKAREVFYHAMARVVSELTSDPDMEWPKWHWGSPRQINESKSEVAEYLAAFKKTKHYLLKSSRLVHVHASPP